MHFFSFFSEKTHLSFSTNEQVFRILNQKKKTREKTEKRKKKSFFFINEHTLKVSNHHIYHPKGKIPCHPGTMVREKKGTRKRTSLNNPLIWRALVSEITRKVYK
jgi:hypothetical protein